MQRHQQMIFRLAYRILKRSEDAEDVVQETFLQAYKRLADCREPKKFGGWVRRIAINKCMNRSTRELPFEEIEDISDSHQPATKSVELEVLQRAELKEIREAIDSLPGSYKALLVLKYEEDLSIKEIAEILGEQPGAVYTRLHRARKLLVERLEADSCEMC